MAEFRTVHIDLPAQSDDDPRLGHLLGRALEENDAPRAVIVGFPSDEGVRRNRGRTGAAAAPEAMRAALYRFTPDPRAFDAFADLLVHTRDLGDLALTGDVEGDQAALGEALAPHLAQGCTAIVIGGGHETAYGAFLGYVEAGRRVEILNWDTHADVRPLRDGRGHSGSPFRQALEHPSHACTHYAVAGLLPYSVAKAHLDYIELHEGRHIWNETLSYQAIDGLYGSFKNELMVSFDLDAVDQPHAPGVSAPAADGLSADLWLYAAFRAGRHAGVRSMDLVELNPRLDRDGQTARLGALTVWWFLKGLSERSEGEEPGERPPGS